MKRRSLLLLFFLFFTITGFTQSLKGIVKDDKNKEGLIGATVAIKGTTIGTSTDLDGNFNLETNTDLPFTLIISYIGYQTKEIIVNELARPLQVFLTSNEKELKEVSVVESRLTEKQRESALTVEAMDIIAIKQTPAANFYDGLGTLKGVDVTAASLGFKVINTRGFNSTSPVRSLQIIDGVDNQAPGLNFSLGNFLGCSELDILKVDLIVGASSAFYGPNAFNGVISMNTRSPFVKPGLEVSIKTGTRNLMETAIRYAFVKKNKEGKEIAGMKFNACYFTANDWEADNRSATPQSKSGVGNPGGYDAVNIYGDEYYSGGDFSLVPALRPGLGIIYRKGYAEKDIVDYNTRNLKLNSSLHYKIQNETELVASSNFGYGTTVYQGDNRYSLKDILFFQNRLELRKQDKFFLRGYITNENAGNSYDAYFTALILQRSVKDDADYIKDYVYFFNSKNYFQKIKNFPGYPQPGQYSDYLQYLAAINPFLVANYNDSLLLYHAGAQQYANSVGQTILNNQAFLEPGTAAFDSALQSVTSRETVAGGGSKFYDKSALFHLHGEYKFNLDSFIFTTGANYRKYLPDSRGTIFSDTAKRIIENQEYGLYAGIDKKVMNDRLKINATLRMDKNENFDYLFSPAASLVYNTTGNQTIRLSFSSAIRNPTLADQYLYYQVGRAILIGNLSGFDSLVTLESLFNGFNYQNPDTLNYFNVKAVKPEQVRTIEAGFRSTFFKKLFVDLNLYYSTYKNFIGYKLGADVDIAQGSPLPIVFNRVLRVATNSEETVKTMGFTIGATYYFGKYYSLNGNYSYNRLFQNIVSYGKFPFTSIVNVDRSEASLIPAYNTPENKFNIGISGMNIDNKIGSNWGFNVNYKWVQGFEFEGSPQFTGRIEDYGVVDAQVNKRFPETKTILKFGCSNVLENLHYEVYGGPLIGRLLYMQLLVELN